jgi:hypothetical protein
MPRFALSLTAAGIIGLALVTVGPAQESPTRPLDTPAGGTTTPSTAQPESTPSQPTDAAASSTETNPTGDSIPTNSTGGSLQAESQRGAFLRASSFIGLPVQGLGDARLGTVGDILIDPRTYEMRYVLIDTGPGVGTNGLPIIPWALFQTSPAGPVKQGFLVVPLSIDRLAQAPATTLGANDLAGNSSWIRDVDHFYSLDLSVRRVSRPELDVEAEAKSRSVEGAATTPGVNDGRETARERMQRRRDRAGTGAAQNPARSRAGAAGRTPGSVDPSRNRGPATRVPGATDNTGRNRGPATTTPGSVDNAGRNRGPASTTPGSVDNAGRNRGPTSPAAPGASGNQGGTSSGGTSTGSGTGNNTSSGTPSGANATGSNNSTP